MRFDWSDAKDAKVRAERGHGFSVPARIFLGRIIQGEDDRQDYGEFRMIAVGRVERRFWAVVYTDREDKDGALRWIVTAWPSEKWEREEWLLEA